MSLPAQAINPLTGTARVAIYLQDAHNIREGMEYAQYAESKGFEAVWQAESRLVREATVPMAAFASVTKTIKVGSGVVDCWSRNPARLAATFSTLDDLAPGRVILGIGAWWDPLAQKVGISRAKPLRAMREIVLNVRALLNNENVTFEGEFVKFDGIELDYVYQERRAKDAWHRARLAVAQQPRRFAEQRHATLCDLRWRRGDRGCLRGSHRRAQSAEPSATKPERYCCTRSM
jgi:alkanesulfonate monooxygenase SsuD/methylene tetrahydromethanopterin reductase-like flavin-dependent oxidoreductase (luciferase family)